MQIEYTTRFVKDLADIKDKRAKKDTEKVLSIIRSAENFIDLHKMLDIKKYEFHGGYRIRYSGKPEWRIRFELIPDKVDPKKKVMLLQLVLPREKYEKYAHTSINENMEKVKLILTEEQLNVLLENSWGYDPEMLPKFVQEVEKEVNDVKNLNIKYYQLFRSICMENLIENHAQYKKLVESIRTTQKSYEKRYEKFYDILETYDDYEEKEYYDEKRKFDSLVSNLDFYVSDMSTIFYLINQVVDNFNDNDIKNLDANYTPETIDINRRID